MKLDYYPDTDSLYIDLSSRPSVESQEVSPGVVLDYDAQDNVVGMEMLHVSKRAPKADIKRLLFETVGASVPEEVLLRETPPPCGKK